MKKALVFWGGWTGHEPDKVSLKLENILEKNGFSVCRFEGLECLADKEKLITYDLIVPCFTMGEIKDDYVENVSFAVSRGVGMAGCHGGMCDAFRNCTTWQFITGGQWVSHPGNDGITYTVNVHHSANPIVEGIDDFEVTSEQYYLHIDPAVEVLASTRFPLANGYHAANKPVDMPVAWTKYWGLGRIFYCSLGHNSDVFYNSPSATLMMERGMLWAANGKTYAQEHALNSEKYDDTTIIY